MNVVKITVNVIPEKQLELTQTLLSMIEPTGKEKNCLSYAVSCDIEDKNTFSLLEEWETRDDLDNHMRSHRFGVLLGARTLLSESPKVQIYTISKSEVMEAVNTAREQNS